MNIFISSLTKYRLYNKKKKNNNNIKMKVAINYTIYLEDHKLKDEYANYIQHYHREAMEQLDYTIKRVSYGIHRNASRYHIHYHTINVIPENVKKYKILNVKIKSLKINSMLYQTFKIPETKLSYHYEYDEEAILRYPLKEYYNNKVMNDDINYEYIYNITDIHLEDLRAEANKIYEKSLKESKEKELKKMEKTQQKKDLYHHLDLVIVLEELPEGGNIEHIMRFTIKEMLLYYKQNNKNFSIHQLKNVAINYLYFKNKITELNIIDYINP